MFHTYRITFAWRVGLLFPSKPVIAVLQSANKMPQIHSYSHCLKCSSDKLGVELFCFRSERRNVYSIDQLARNFGKSTSFHLNSNLALNSALILPFFSVFSSFKSTQTTAKNKLSQISYDAIFCYLPNQAYAAKSRHKEVATATRYCFILLLNCH